MSLGTLREELDHCTDQADESIWFKSDRVRWDVHELIENSSIPSSVQTNIEPIINYVMELSHMAEPCHVVIMSNGGFQGIYEKLQKRFA